MKKYSSVMMLYLGSVFKKMLLLFGATGLVEMYLFIRTYQLAFHPGSGSIFTIGSPIYTLAEYQKTMPCIFADTRLGLVFFLSLALLTVLLALNGLERKEKISYTIRRLSLPEKVIYLVQGFSHSMVYLLFFAFQIILVFLMGQYYLANAPESFYTHQTLFLTFYSDSFLHSLLPLEETTLMLRNILLIFAFGFETAYFSYGLRLGKKPLLLPIMLLLTIIWFESELGYWLSDFLSILMYVVILCQIGFQLIRKEERRQ